MPLLKKVSLRLNILYILMYEVILVMIKYFEIIRFNIEIKQTILKGSLLLDYRK